MRLFLLGTKIAAALEVALIAFLAAVAVANADSNQLKDWVAGAVFFLIFIAWPILAAIIAHRRPTKGGAFTAAALFAVWPFALSRSFFA